MTNASSPSADAEREIIALRKTVAVLKKRVHELQNRQDDTFAMFGSMAHLEALVEARTRELQEAKDRVEETVRQRTEELRRKAAELEQANELLREMERMRTHFLQNVSHELKTPLVAIHGYSELLRNRFNDNLSPQQLEFVDVVLRNAEHLNRLVEDLVHASQSARGISPLRLGTYDLNALIYHCVQEVRPFADRGAVALHPVVPDERTEVVGDRRQVRQMLVNLLTNAIKFSDDCRRREVEIKLKPGDDSVVLDVRDYGIGIPQVSLSRIFERFYQVDTSETRKYGGMGIGLSLVKEVIENHRGSIMVESTPGQGSRFVVRLPRDPQGTLMPGQELGEGRGPDVVVLDSGREGGDLYPHVLREIDLNVAVTDDPDRVAAIQREAERPAVLIVNLARDTPSEARIVAEVEALANAQVLPPLLVVTTHKPEDFDNHPLRAIARHTLYQPFPAAALRDAVLGLLHVVSGDN